MSAGYSGTLLPQKIGVKPGATLTLLHAPDGISAEFAPLPPGAAIATKPVDSMSLALLFCGNAAALSKHLKPTAAKLHADGALWIGWPRKTSPLFVDLTEDMIRKIVLPTGLVDVKVCAINSDWSGLKLMVRKERRPGWRSKGT
jgi:hypothetical protein